MNPELSTLTTPDNWVTELRKLMPSHSLTYGQALTLADRQATATRRLLNSKQAAFDLSWAFEHADVIVELRPEYRMPDGTSGITTKLGEHLTIFVNASEPRLRQRFTLAHELKHVLDFDLVDAVYSKLGRGNSRLQSDQIEWICNRYAASLLMPKSWVNRLWGRGIQDPLALAHVFQVSAEAMTVRLEALGYLGTIERPSDTFFRQGLPESDEPRMSFPEYPSVA